MPQRLDTSEFEFKARQNLVDADDILDFASFGDARSIEYLKRLKAEYKWSSKAGDQKNWLEQLGVWVDVVCEFLDKGYVRIVELSRDDDLFPYCLALLESVITSESLAAVHEISQALPAYSSESRDKYVAVAGSIGSLTFDKGPKRSAAFTECLRDFLHHLLEKRMPQHMRRVVVSALQGIGDQDSIKRIELLPPITGPFKGLEGKVIDEIRKRLCRK